MNMADLPLQSNPGKQDGNTPSDSEKMVLDEEHETDLPGTESAVAAVSDQEQDVSVCVKELAIELEKARATIAGLQQQKEQAAPTIPESPQVTVPSSMNKKDYR